MTILTSGRLRYEPFADQHFDGLHAMNRDPDVMRYILGRPETPAETRAMIARVRARWAAPDAFCRAHATYPSRILLILIRERRDN